MCKNYVCRKSTNPFTGDEITDLANLDKVNIDHFEYFVEHIDEFKRSERFHERNVQNFYNGTVAYALTL